MEDKEGNTALHIAVANGHDEIANILLRCPGFDCTLKNIQGHTAFYVAMDGRNVRAAQAILERDPSLALQVSPTHMFGSESIKCHTIGTVIFTVCIRTIARE